MTKNIKPASWSLFKVDPDLHDLAKFLEQLRSQGKELWKKQSTYNEHSKQIHYSKRSYYN